MVQVVLDTTTVSALMRGDERTVARLRRLARQEVALPQPVLAEIAYGLARLPRSRRRDDLQRRFERIRDELPRLPWTDEVSARFGDLKAAMEKKGQRVDDFDLAVAAHALAAGATLATSNLRHFARLPGLAVEDWSAPG